MKTSFPDTYPIPHGRRVDGRLRVPSSKSLTQRYFDLAMVGRRPLTVRRPLLSEDTHLFLGALQATGFRVERDGDDLRLEPGPPPPRGERREIFCGNGGTLFRFATAALAAVPGRYRLDGVERLRERTVGPLIEALRGLGAEIVCTGREGFAPLEIEGRTLGAGRTRLDASISSQYLSALLLAALAAPGPVEVEVEALTSQPYVDLTFDAAAELGARLHRDGKIFSALPWTDEAAVREVVVEADFSSVAYPAAAAALAGRARIDDVKPTSHQGDRGFLDLLAEMGASVRWTEGGVEVEMPADGLRAVEADLSQMPDQVPTLAALAPFARGTTRILNVPHLRHKECDRLAAMATELGRLGAQVRELEDGLIIEGVWADGVPETGEPIEVDTWSDHRIAMSLALVGLRRPGVVIRQPGVVVKSYPGFWEDFESLLA